MEKGSGTVERVAIDTEHIRLDQLLKLAQLVQGGGEAKLRIQCGEVAVNGVVEVRRGRKLRPGDRVRLGGVDIQVAEAEG